VDVWCSRDPEAAHAWIVANAQGQTRAVGVAASFWAVTRLLGAEDAMERWKNYSPEDKSSSFDTLATVFSEVPVVSTNGRRQLAETTTANGFASQKLDAAVTRDFNDGGDFEGAADYLAARAAPLLNGSGNP
jgi:hypothetical protein